MGGIDGPSPAISPVVSESELRPYSATKDADSPPRRPRSLQEILTSVTSIVKNRTGSVLARKMILKSDHFDTGLHVDQDFHLQGAPNFRMTDFNVFGVAQPTVSGIATILTLLGCHPDGGGTQETIFISSREEPLIYLNWRPFVLRYSDNPFQNVKTYQGISSTRLEQMEARLKEDILKEAERYNNLLLVHDEIENGRIVPSWIAVGEIRTPREVFDGMKASGFRVKYTRIPISPEQAPEDSYLDEFVKVVKHVTLDDPLVFNCGMGVGRTTFAMVAAVLCRRAQMLAIGDVETPIVAPFSSKDSWLGPTDNIIFDEVASQNRAILRLVYVLEKGFTSKASTRSAIEWALARGPLIDDLKNAVLGNYQHILQLVSVLQNGSDNKKILDEAINRCDSMTNLREVILLHRVKFSDTGAASELEKAMGCLERYFFLLAFTSYVSENIEDNFAVTFRSWLNGREEITRMLEYLRRKGARLELFRPVEDLTLLSENPSLSSRILYNSERPMTNELEKFVIRGRQGSVLVQHTILKADHWPQQQRSTQIPIEGASNMRKIPGWPIFGVAQPTIQGLKTAVSVLTVEAKKMVAWINLREEPMCYINGNRPYVLRDQTLTLRNMKSYSGITASRLEQIELRLKEDILAELQNFDNRILVHAEAADSAIVPIWEECLPQNVLTLREVIDLLKRENDPLELYRIPVTAEQAPDDTDYDNLLQVLSKLDLKDTAVVLNCQVGLGRSTTGTIIASLVLHWLQGLKPLDPPPSDADEPVTPQKPLNYQVIHSLMRVIRNGTEIRHWVDLTIDRCSIHSTNIRNVIDTWKQTAESETNDRSRKRSVRKGLSSLRRYFGLIAFAAYLRSISPNELSAGLETFKSWMARRKEFTTMLEEMERGGLQSLVPVERLSPGDGIALTDEVLEVVNNRTGSVLAQQTILKVDVFPGAQKLSLTDRIDGAPNYRKIDLGALLEAAKGSKSLVNELSVYGIGMPRKHAITGALERVGAGPGGPKRLLWTSLREEPVIYVKGRPFVLRLFQEPMKNLEITGIARDRVEQMEEQMKADCIAELEKYGGRLLLHSEEQVGSGFSIVPVWETVNIDEIETPLQAYNSIAALGYQVDYKRIPITDEQAPIPDVFDQLVDRLARFDGNTDAMFNCQMGRGRTTTGIVTACLLKIIVGNKALLETDDASWDNSVPTSATLTDDDRLRQRYLAGEYKIILQLIAVLVNGRLAKSLTDLAIDHCEHLQNLRKAIYDYKLRVEAAEVGSKKWHSIREVGLNYLIRYFYLIVFADYLLEEYCVPRPARDDDLTAAEIASAKRLARQRRVSANSNRSVQSSDRLKFSEWLEDRREIQNIAKKSNQSLD
ncbi:inositol hexakisphosphate-domain-containing protein [Zopfochytrium polystomum]|nr:inositol hexakisphosphate-domain-containing protein [Zopfochytrium polystomum]